MLGAVRTNDRKGEMDVGRVCWEDFMGEMGFYLFIHIYICIHVHMCVYACMDMCCVCMYIYTHIYNITCAMQCAS